MPAAPTFHAGNHGKLKAIQGSAVDLPADKWDFTFLGNNKNVPNSRDGRLRIPGLPDANGTFDLPYDTANDPTITANGGITVSAIIVMNFYVDDTHFWAATIIVDEIGAAMEIEGDKGIAFPVKWSLQSGTMTPPTYP